MRFLVVASLFLGAHAGEDDGSGVSVAVSASMDRTMTVPAVSFSTSYFPAPSWPGIYRPSCPYNNCQSCTTNGCYWTGASCSGAPCSGWGSCASYPSQCGGCQFDSQCGASRRCENGQCVGVAGDRACDYYRDCVGCLGRPNCLWDPNTLGGSCKPKEQCDFTYQQRELVFATAYASPPPASACVRTLDRCNQRDFTGTPLDLNNERGIGCTNHGQCNPGQYCFSCSKCIGSCGGCRSSGVPVSGMCGPAYRCPIDGDSISDTCPGGGIIQPPVSSCSLWSCSSCTAAYGCIWSGTSCYYSNTPCYNPGCANTPDQCFSGGIIQPPVSSCSLWTCSSCTAAYGCIWSGTSCYYSNTPCYNPGCANTPDQCSSYYSPVPYTPYNPVPYTPYNPVPYTPYNPVPYTPYNPVPYTPYNPVPYYPTTSCEYYSNCVGCLSNSACLWDPNSFTHCKPKEQCDFTYRQLNLFTAAASYSSPPATACVRTVDRCSQTDFTGSVLNPNPERGIGCTNHGQCLPGQYCFSCAKCRGACAPCNQGGFPVSGGCGPVSRCPIDLDSINNLCPVA